MTLAEYKARPKYDPFRAYKDFQAHPENYVLVADIVREVMPGIVKSSAVREMRSCRTVDACREVYAKWREKIEDPELLKLLADEGKRMAVRLTPKKTETL